MMMMTRPPLALTLSWHPLWSQEGVIVWAELVRLPYTCKHPFPHSCFFLFLLFLNLFYILFYFIFSLIVWTELVRLPYTCKHPFSTFIAMMRIYCCFDLLTLGPQTSCPPGGQSWGGQSRGHQSSRLRIFHLSEQRFSSLYCLAKVFFFTLPC